MQNAELWKHCQSLYLDTGRWGDDSLGALWCPATVLSIGLDEIPSILALMLIRPWQNAGLS
jgi:hypothetical protein